MRLEHAVDGGLRPFQVRERTLLESRREPGGQKKRVLIPERDRQALRKARDHVATRL